MEVPFFGFLVEATGFEPTTFASRTQRATSCATPRFFKFLSIFVSGQTCGQATYFERFVEKYTARIVRFFKGFSDFQKSLLQDRWRCPEPYALPAALRLGCSFNAKYRMHYSKYFSISQSIFNQKRKIENFFLLKILF